MPECIISFKKENKDLLMVRPNAVNTCLQEFSSLPSEICVRKGLLCVKLCMDTITSITREKSINGQSKPCSGVYLHTE